MDGVHGAAVAIFFEQPSQHFQLSLILSVSLYLSPSLFPFQFHSQIHSGIDSKGNFYRPTGTKNPTFMEMLKSAKSTSQDEELDDDGDFVIKKETSTANKGIICYAHTRQ